MAATEFLNPKSMTTPGAAGALTMLITNVLGAQFGLQRNYTGLIVSFLLGLIVFKAAHLSVLARVAYYVLNSLIIFAVALGTNGAAASKTSGTPQEVTTTTTTAPPPTTTPTTTATAPTTSTVTTTRRTITPKTMFFKEWLKPTTR